MRVNVLSKLESGDRGLYRIFYKNGYVYCGSFVNSYLSSHPKVIAETYFGSSKVAKNFGWVRGVSGKDSAYNKSKIDQIDIWYLPEEKARLQVKLEQRLIRYCAYLYGIADCALLLDKGKNNGFTSKYKSGGRLINLQAQDMSNAYDKAHTMLKEGIVSEAQRAHYSKMPEIGSRSRTRETFKKISKTRSKSKVRNHSTAIEVDGIIYRNPTKAAIAIGNKNYNVSINRKVSSGLKEFEYRGHKFKVVNRRLWILKF